MSAARASHPLEEPTLAPTDSESGFLTDGPHWYRDAVIYELHVRSFADSNGDGIGDFRGLRSKLDYLQDLGVSALWLLPFYPSPLRDDGYDIADYRRVNPDYGSLPDFQAFLEEAHRRGLRVITELVINHTSDQHPWFQRARRSPPGSAERDFYVWSDTPDRYRDARIIFQDFEPSNWTWDPVAEAYYWHRFYHHQPDLNFDNPAVQEELFRILEFWLDMGVDGMRLDAIPYLYQREGTNCENLPETHAFLKKLRAHVDAHYDNRLLLAEANQWPEDAATYFGDGDECHMNFHFPLMPRLFMSVRMEDRFPIADILEQTPELPEGCQWGLFLRNHDELTLEMVTDEERDYMYRVYAQDPTARINLGIRRRLAPLLDNNRRKIELLNSLLLSLPGTPVLYYGDEIGMGDNHYLGDRNGVRTPMQWSGDRNAGFSRANPQKLFLPVVIDPEYHYESVNVEAQNANPSSLLWWTKRVLALRAQHRAFGRGSLEWLSPSNPKVLAFLRRLDGGAPPPNGAVGRWHWGTSDGAGERGHEETILVVANLSRFAQVVEMDLDAFDHHVPTELFGRTPFPEIHQGEPYRLTLGPHAFYWFVLEPREERERRARGLPEGHKAVRTVPELSVTGDWAEVFLGRRQERVGETLVGFLQRQRWFGGKRREIRAGSVMDVFPLEYEGGTGRLLLHRVEYVSHEPETHLIPSVLATEGEAERILDEAPESVLFRLRGPNGTGVVREGIRDRSFCRALLSMVAREGRIPGRGGWAVVGEADRPAQELEGDDSGRLEPRPGSAEQSNSSIFYGDRWILKLFRRVEPGENLDLEIGRHLAAVDFPHSPRMVGALHYERDGRRWGTAGVLHEYVPNQGDAWKYTLDLLDRYFEEALASPLDPGDLPAPVDVLEAAERGPIPSEAQEAIGPYLELARLLGERTADLHRALADSRENPDFDPEPFSTLYQRSLYQSVRNLLGASLKTLSGATASLGDDERRMAHELMEARDGILQHFQDLLDQKMEGRRIRTHGDYHLGQVLWTGKDFQIIDFEGEPARALSERRLKRAPLRDVAGMLRSFDYAARSSLSLQAAEGLVAEPSMERARSWADFWYRWVAVDFLQGYLEGVQGSALLPDGFQARRRLLDLFLLEKGLYELGYELNNRPDWVRIPLQGIHRLVKDKGALDV